MQSRRWTGCTSCAKISKHAGANAGDISTSYANISTRLNKDFRELESDTARRRQVSSYGLISLRKRMQRCTKRNRAERLKLIGFLPLVLAMKFAPVDEELKRLMKEQGLREFDPYRFDAAMVRKVMSLRRTATSETTLNVVDALIRHSTAFRKSMPVAEANGSSSALVSLWLPGSWSRS